MWWSNTSCRPATRNGLVEKKSWLHVVRSPPGTMVVFVMQSAFML